MNLNPFSRIHSEIKDMRGDLNQGIRDIQYHIMQLELKLIRSSRKIMADLGALQDAVTQETTVQQSAILLLETLAADLEAAKTDPAAIQAIVDSINGNSSALADAVAANTPSA